MSTVKGPIVFVLLKKSLYVDFGVSEEIMLEQGPIWSMANDALIPEVPPIRAH